MKTKYLWGILPLIPLLMFSVQGHILRERFSAIGCTKIMPLLAGARSCSNGICEQQYEASVTKPYLVLGHVIKTHMLYDFNSGQEILPATVTDTLLEDRWPELFVYRFSKPTRILVKASFPEFASMKGFSGVDPRECPNERVLSVVNIPRVLTGISKTFLAVFVAIAFLASIFGTSHVRNVPFYRSSRYLTIAVLSFALTFLVGDHFFDALKLSLRVSEDSLRTLALFGLLLPAFGFSKNKWSSIIGTATGIVGLCLFLVDHSYFPVYGEISLYRVVFAAALGVGITGLLLRRDWFGIIIFIPACIDSIHIFGVRIPDFPPIYWNLFVTGTFCIRIAWEQGVKDILPLAWRALELVRANFNFHSFSNSLDLCLDTEATFQAGGTFEDAFRLVPRAASCERVGLLFLSNKDTPITVTYDAATDTYKHFDDGKVEGHVFSRVLIYKEQFWFESIERLKEIGYKRLQTTKELEDAKYFCAIPLFDRGSLIGILSFTRFNDLDIGSKNRAELREQIRMQIELIAKRLESYFRSKALSEFEKSKGNVEQLKRHIDDIYTVAKDDSSFLVLVLEEVQRHTGSSILVFKRSSLEKAELWRQSGLTVEEEAAWREIPLNVNPTVGNRIGPYIVAFNEGKSSYVKRISDVLEQLHPHSQKLFTSMSAQTVITIPFKMNDDDCVMSIISRADKACLSHAWMDIIEEVRPTIIANIHALKKSSSLEAYGRLAARFIDNVETRNTLMALAKEGDLPITVGQSIDSLIFVVDLMGSSTLDADAQTKANLYGEFYDRISQAGRDLLRVSILKKTGDGAILGGKTPLVGEGLRKGIVDFVRDCNSTALRIGCGGARVSIHFGNYFTGLIGTKSSGAIDAIGAGIDCACKLEDQMKSWKRYGVNPHLGLTKSALNYLISKGALADGDLPVPSGLFLHFESYYLFGDAEDIYNYPSGLLSKSGLPGSEAA